MSSIAGLLVSGGVRVLMAAKPVDFRKGADGLAAVAKEVLAQDPFSGVLIVYRSKRADRVKILVWDGSGLVLVWKRLEKGAFKWPPITDGVMRLSSAQFSALFEGLEWTRMDVPEIARPQAVR
jgi:transposase